MAKKKKAKKSKVKVEEPKKAAQKPKKKDNTGLVVGIIVVIVIVVALILLLRSCAKEEAAPVTPTAPSTEQPVTPETPAGPEKVSEKPEEIRYCTEAYAIGWPKNKLGTPCEYSGTKVAAQIQYSGKGEKIDGMYFYITTANGDLRYYKDSRQVKQGDLMEYTLDVGEIIESMVALPLTTEDGMTKACLNQRLLIVKEESCVVS
ncbi:hypothetical protein KY308_00165 [Candidatus Woesearchaeota archaeon]|nr:hypothetical protein [Candidatus Woesearchaeota archaeon]